MADAFLDSSALVDLVFRNQALRLKVQSCVPPGGRAVTSRYVIYEINRGFLRNCILLYNASLRAQTFSDVFGYVGRMNRRGHFVGTALGSFEDFYKDRDAGNPLTPGQSLTLFRAEMRKKIRRGWRKLQSGCSEVRNPTGCRSDLQPPVFDNAGTCEHEIKTRFCGQLDNCGLAAYLNRFVTDFANLLSELEGLPQKDAETERRIAALRRLLNRRPHEGFSGSDCYRCGDAIICHEAKSDGLVVSKNAAHFAPICERLGLRLGAYE